MSSYPIFVGPGGADPAKHILDLAVALRPTVGDALYGGQIIRSRILQRTAQGVDADGSPFAAYSDSYRKRKIGLLGHADTVDLFGPASHTHMLNTMLVKAGGQELGQGATASENATPADLFEVGFYSTESVRAKAHNEGATIRSRSGSATKAKSSKSTKKTSFTMPRRHFLDANADDLTLVSKGIGERILERMRSVK